jgi:hypothetical protein
MDEKKLNTILEALASHIERLEAEIYALRYEKEQLKKDNQRLKEAEKFLIEELASSEVDDGLL